MEEKKKKKKRGDWKYEQFGIWRKERGGEGGDCGVGDLPALSFFPGLPQLPFKKRKRKGERGGL